MEKKSFFNRTSAAVCLLHAPVSIAESMAECAEAKKNGADAIALEMFQLPLAERTEANFRSLIDSVDLPFMFIDYRNDRFIGGDDEARQKYLFMAIDAGAEVVDVMGDLFDPAPYELTRQPEAVARQKALISEIHERGAKVIMSSHMVNAERSAEEVLEHLLVQSERGADILKIVVSMDTPQALTEGIRTILLLHEKLDKPFVFLSGGRYNHFFRYAGAKLGSAIEFGVNCHRPESIYHQPTIASFRKVIDNFNWDINSL